jgi:hypothetical protein
MIMIGGRNGSRINKQDAVMSITACHANGCPLELKRLLKADDANFAHDAFGICRHIDTQTGKLDGTFLPRYAVKQ